MRLNLTLSNELSERIFAEQQRLGLRTRQETIRQLLANTLATN